MSNFVNSIKDGSINLVSGLLDWVGLGTWFKNVIGKGEDVQGILRLQDQLSRIKKQYSDKTSYYENALELLISSELPFPSAAMTKINQKKQEIKKKLRDLQSSRDLVDELGTNLIEAKRSQGDNVNTNLSESLNDYQNTLKGEINEELSKQEIETKL